MDDACNHLDASTRRRADTTLGLALEAIGSAEVGAAAHGGFDLTFATDRGDVRHEFRLQSSGGTARLFHAATAVKGRRRTWVSEHTGPDGSEVLSAPSQAAALLDQWRSTVDAETPSALASHARIVSDLAAILPGLASHAVPVWASAHLVLASATERPMVGVWGEGSRTLTRYGVASDPFCSGTLSPSLLAALGTMSDAVHVSSFKPTSDPGVEVAIGRQPRIEVSSDLDAMARLRSMALATSRDLRLSG